MGKLLNQLNHAFSVGPIPSDDDAPLPEPLFRLAKSIVERGMETPAIILLESMRPLSFLTGQTMLAAWPLIKLAAGSDDFRIIAEALEDRQTVHRLVNRIEDLSRQKEASP